MNRQEYPDEPEKSPKQLSLWRGNLHRQPSCKERWNSFFLVSALILPHLHTADLAQTPVSVMLTPTLWRLSELLWFPWARL